MSGSMPILLAIPASRIPVVTSAGRAVAKQASSDNQGHGDFLREMKADRPERSTVIASKGLFHRMCWFLNALW